MAVGQSLHKLQPLSIDGKPYNGTTITLIQDSRNLIWFGGYEGLHKYDGVDLVSYECDPFDSLTLSDSKIHNIYENQNGSLWISTQNGVNLYNRLTDRFERFLYKDTLATWVNQCLQSTSGSIWLLSLKKGLGTFDPDDQNTFRHSVLKETFKNEELLLSEMLITSENGLYVGSSHGLFYLVDEYKGIWKNYLISVQLDLSTGFDTIYSIRQNKTFLLLATGRGLVYFDTVSKKFLAPDDVQKALGIITFSSSADDEVLILSQEKIIYQYQSTTKELVRRDFEPSTFELPLSGFTSIFKDHEGTVWYTSLQGVFKSERNPFFQSCNVSGKANF